jgi:hypothetical protein
MYMYMRIIIISSSRISSIINLQNNNIVVPKERDICLVTGINVYYTLNIVNKRISYLKQQKYIQNKYINKYMTVRVYCCNVG